MKSKIARAIKLKYNPVALIWSDKKEEGAKQFKKGKWGCIMWLVSNAAKGGVSVCDKDTFGCFGGGVGMGFGDQYENFPGGKEFFCYFLSSGNQSWDEGRKMAEKVKPFMRKESHEEFIHGERYKKTPEYVKKFIQDLPITQIPARYVVFKPLKNINKDEIPQSVTFIVDPNQLSALVVLANYGRDDNDNVIIPFAAGCQSIGIYPYHESKSEKQRAVIGLTDLSARFFVQKQLGNNFMSFTIPFAMFREMEDNVEGSFLERPTWQRLMT